MALPNLEGLTEVNNGTSICFKPVYQTAILTKRVNFKLNTTTYSPNAE